MQTVYHTIAPVFDENAHTLILGSMPSPASRNANFFYGHAHNRFWRVLADVFDEPLPADICAKKRLILQHNLALWDVLAQCTIRGAADSTIQNAVPNDLSIILAHAPVTRIFTLGKTAHTLYTRLQLPTTKIAAVYLPSTSPANQTITYAQLKEAFMVVRG